MGPELDLAPVIKLAFDLRPQRGELTVREVAARYVDLVASIGTPDPSTSAVTRVHAFWIARFTELSPEQQELARASDKTVSDARCLVLVASRAADRAGEDEPCAWAHGVVPMTPAALAKAPMLAELVARLSLGAVDPASSVATFHVGGDRAPSTMLDEAFVRRFGIRDVFAVGAGLPTGSALVVVAFATRPLAEAAPQHLKLLALRLLVALLGASETRSRLSSENRHQLRADALEALSLASEALRERDAIAATARVKAAVDATKAEAASRQAELVATNAKLRRTQRAVLNVVDDLRKAREELEARVEERTARERVLRQEAEAARAHAEGASRMKDQFLSTVSHELRTPLNAILGWATMLRGGTLDSAKTVTALDTIERNARAQVRLIEDLLDLGRILQGKFQLAVGPVEVVRVVEAAIDSLRPAAEAKGVRLQRALDSHATIIGDAERLQQVVWNLLANAVKFTPRGGRVHVTVQRAPSFVEIAVTDSGMGIDPSLLPHVFEPFRQGEAAISKRTGGLGLGLSIVRSLVELHGGTVKAWSEGAERGSTFTVRIPVAPIRAPASEPGRANDDGATTPTFEHPSELVGAHILIVDDERDTRELLAFVLEECGAHVTTAESAREAVETLIRTPFDVIVSDVGMPDEDGLSMIARIRKLPADKGGRVPAAALTAYARSEDRARAIRAGFDTHLAKPIDPSELALVVAALIRNKRAWRQEPAD